MTHFVVIMGDLNAQIGKILGQETSVGNHGIGTRNGRGQMLVEFAEARSLHIMNTFFEKPKYKKWTWKSPTGSKNGIDFILTNKRDIVKDVTALSKVNVGSDHRMVRSEFKFNLRRERNKLIRKPLPNLVNLKNKETEFKLNIQNRYSLLDEENIGIDEMSERFSTIVKEAALEVGGKKHKEKYNKLSAETKTLMQKRREMKVRSVRNKIEYVELTKTINKKRKEDVRKFNVQKINEAIVAGTSVKVVKRKLGIGKNQMYAIKKPNNEITYNRNEIIKVVEEFYTDLYNSGYFPQNNTNAENIVVPEITVDEVKNAVKGMKRGKAPAEDCITIDLIKDA